MHVQIFASFVSFTVPSPSKTAKHPYNANPPPHSTLPCPPCAAHPWRRGAGQYELHLYVRFNPLLPQILYPINVY